MLEVKEEEVNDIIEEVKKVHMLDAIPSYLTGKFGKNYVQIISGSTGIKGWEEVEREERRKKQRLKESIVMKKTYVEWRKRKQKVMERSEEMWGMIYCNRIRESEKLSV